MSKQSPTVDSSSDRNYKQEHYYDDVQLFKEVVFQNDSEDDFTDGKRLTSLVRESYVKRLRDLLKQNYQVWCGSCENVNNSENINLSSTDIEKCVKFLEQKALRSCMIAALYQKSMIQLLSDIKHKTKDYKLFDNLNKIEKLNLFTGDKYVQTDQKLPEKHHVETQTFNEVLDSTNKKQVRSTTSLLDLPLPNPRDVLLSLGSNFIDKNNLDFMQNNNLFKTPSVNNPNETIAKVQPQPRKPQSKISSNNILIHNEGFVPESKRRKISNDLNCNSNVLEKNNLNDLINNLGVIMQTDSDLNNKLQIENISNVDIEINSNVNKTCDDNLVSLDDRLAELGLFVDDESNNSSNKSSVKNTTNRTSTLKGRRSSWFIEMTAHYCNFIKIFLTLNDDDRVKVKGKFKKLFGTIEEEEEEHSSVELTENNLTICRKRTANMVVYELTPYYEAKRILSRHLFKEFAKRVTDSIMERTYAADSQAVNQFITEYFNEHEYVCSLDDFEF